MPNGTRRFIKLFAEEDIGTQLSLPRIFLRGCGRPGARSLPKIVLVATFGSFLVAPFLACFSLVLGGSKVFGASSARHDQVDSELKLLWEIGTADDRPQEFALAPDRFAEFREDPVFIVGLSRPEKDWNYVHPGPTDQWAGSRAHTFAVFFGLADRPTSACRLIVDLVDSHPTVFPRLQIVLNGRVVADSRLPAGSEGSVHGNLSEAKERRLEVNIPAEFFARGTNTLELITVEGSWLIYDQVALFAPSNVQLVAVNDQLLVRKIRPLPALIEYQGELRQVIECQITSSLEETIRLEAKWGLSPGWSCELPRGDHVVYVPVSRVQEPTDSVLVLRVGDKTVVERKISIRPVRAWTVYILPHSHVDIGYTELQTKIEQDHWRFFEEAIEAAWKTSDGPAEAVFRWNVEVLWAVDSYLRQASPEKKEAFLAAVREGHLGLQALYGNQLTALCRPEELVRLIDCAARLSQEYGLTIDSAMISDVPGYTWGLVSVLADAGVKYFSIGPNLGHRVGHTLRVWGDQAFWWRSPDGQHRVLCWVPRRGYYRGFLGEEALWEHLTELEKSGYPLEIVQLRHCAGDNAGPDVSISSFVREWNSRFTFPKLVIATSSEMMQELERRHGDALPEVGGDFTPYWEDGAASSALETALNRDAAERLVMAEALWARWRAREYPDEAFYQAWRNVLLYDEHTWGAYNSVTEPDSPFAQAQWAIKRQFAVDADRQSRELFLQAVAPLMIDAQENSGHLLVLNPCGWTRSGLVVIPQQWAAESDCVVDGVGRRLPTQRLRDGRLAFLSGPIPGYGAVTSKLQNNSAAFSPPSAVPTAPAAPAARAVGNRLENSRLLVEIDPETGAVAKMLDKITAVDFVDRSGGLGLADYFYVAGRDPSAAQRAEGPVTIEVLEGGPLVAAIRVQSPAPGAHRLIRTYQLVEGQDDLQITVTIDKQKVRTPEGVHLAFPFAVSGGTVRMEIPWGIVRPEVDQLPGACRNYFTVQRWIDVSSDRMGITWVNLHAPMVELGAIRVDVPKPFQPEGWLTEIPPSQTIYSYVMNNYWETNYKADQEGPTTFEYYLRPNEGGFNPASVARYAVGRNRPLVVIPAGGKVPPQLGAPVILQPDEILPETFKVSRDGKGFILRLFGTVLQPTELRILPGPAASWSKVYRSNLLEEKLEPIDGIAVISPLELITLRLE